MWRPWSRLYRADNDKMARKIDANCVRVSLSSVMPLVSVLWVCVSLSPWRHWPIQWRDSSGGANELEKAGDREAEAGGTHLAHLGHVPQSSLSLSSRSFALSRNVSGMCRNFGNVTKSLSVVQRSYVRVFQYRQTAANLLASPKPSPTRTQADQVSGTA